MKREGGGVGLRVGTATAELKLSADRALHSPLLPQGGVEAGAGGGPLWERRGGGSLALPSLGEHAGSESGQQLGGFLPLG